MEKEEYSFLGVFILAMIFIGLILFSLFFSENSFYDTYVYCDSLEGCDVYLCKSHNAYELEDIDIARYFLERYESCTKENQQ